MKENQIAEIITTIAQNLLTLSTLLTEQEKPQPAPPKEAPTKAPTIELSQVRSLLAKLSSSGKAKEVKELIESFNVKKLSDIDPSHYQELYEKAKVIQDA